MVRRGLTTFVVLAAWFWPLLVALAGIAMVYAGVPPRPSLLWNLMAACFLATPVVATHLFQQTPSHLHWAERAAMAVVTGIFLTFLETAIAGYVLVVATLYAFIL